MTITSPLAAWAHHSPSRLSHRILMVFCDALALLISWHLTLNLRLDLNPWMANGLTPDELISVAPPPGILFAIWTAAAMLLGLYRTRQNLSVGDELLRATASILVFVTATIVMTFFLRMGGTEMSRGFVLLFAPVALLIMMTIRYARIALAATIEEYWPSRERVAVAGAGEYALQLANQVRSSDDCRFVGLVLPASGPRGGATKSEPVLGDSSRIGEVINREKLDRIVIAGSTLEENEVQHCLQTARRMGVVATQVLGYSVPGARMVLTSEYGVPAIEWRPESTDWRADGVKRGLDFTFSLLLLIALSPLLLVIAALIKLTSAGPVFYVSTRAGKGGRHFRFLKFRTMRHGNARAAVNGRNEKSGHIFKIRQDPRITPVGRWLRRTSLDELPQLINVLRGEMSLVGPRPLPAEDLDPDGNSAQFAYWARTRSSVLPGITGLWQIRGRSELSFQQTMDFDIRYVEDWSLVLDARILLETPLAILVGRGAY